jgi:hypothetical protein
MIVQGAFAQCSPFVAESYDRFSKKTTFSIKPLVLKSSDHQLFITIDVESRQLRGKWKSPNGNENPMLDPDLPGRPFQIELLFDDDKPAEYLSAESPLGGEYFWISGIRGKDERLDRIWSKLKSRMVVALRVNGLDQKANYPLTYDLTSENQMYFKSIINCIEK